MLFAGDWDLYCIVYIFWGWDCGEENLLYKSTTLHLWSYCSFQSKKVVPSFPLMVLPKELATFANQVYFCVASNVLSSSLSFFIHAWKATQCCVGESHSLKKTWNVFKGIPKKENMKIHLPVLIPGWKAPAPAAGHQLPPKVTQFPPWHTVYMARSWWYSWI